MLNTNRVYLLNIVYGTPPALSCSATEINFFSTGCFEPSSINCHPLCSTCYKINDRSACATPSPLGEIVFSTATCEIGKSYSEEDEKCLNIVEKYCHTNCRGQCFRSNDLHSCLNLCYPGRFYNYNTQTCDGKNNTI